MKNTILLIAAILFPIIQAKAQFTLGISGGVNLTKGKLEFMSTPIDVSGVVYYYFGVVPKYRLNSKLSLSSDIQYSPKGLKTNNEFDITTKLKYSYLDFLPKVEYQLLKDIEIGLGVNFGLKMDEFQKIDEKNWESTKEIGTITSSDFGIVGSIRASLNNFFIIVSYNYGLTDIFNSHLYHGNGQYLQVFNGSQYNRNLQIGLGYFFEFRKE